MSNLKQTTIPGCKRKAVGPTGEEPAEAKARHALPKEDRRVVESRNRGRATKRMVELLLRAAADITKEHKQQLPAALYADCLAEDVRALIVSEYPEDRNLTVEKNKAVPFMHRGVRKTDLIVPWSICHGGRMLVGYSVTISSTAPKSKDLSGILCVVEQVGIADDLEEEDYPQAVVLNFFGANLRSLIGFMDGEARAGEQ